VVPNARKQGWIQPGQRDANKKADGIIGATEIAAWNKKKKGREKGMLIETEKLPISIKACSVGRMRKKLNKKEGWLRF